MEPDEIDHAVTSAEHYVDAQMAPADLVSIVSLDSSLQVNQDFTTDRALLKKQLEQFSSGGGQGFEEGTTGTTEGTPDTGQPFTADDTEYNIFNTDRRLEALRSVAEKLSYVQQKKSLIYFSSGMDRTGIENESELRAAVNAAVCGPTWRSTPWTCAACRRWWQAERRRMPKPARRVGVFRDRRNAQRLEFRIYSDDSRKRW